MGATNVTKAYVNSQVDDLENRLVNGQINLPTLVPPTVTFAGGVNHCPDSDFSYSLDAATVEGTTPASAGDGNFETYRVFRQLKSANITADAAYSLKSVGESTYAANEGTNHEIPDWDRVNGWGRMGGASGHDQYDIAFQLLSKIVGPGQTWYVRVRLVSLDGTVIPDDVQFAAGVWVKNGGTQGWASGSAFDLTYQIHGIPGSTSRDYRVLAKTDGGEEILSNVLTIANTPDDLSIDNYVSLFFAAGAGFIEFAVYQKTGSNYTLLQTIRNTTDLQYNDIGAPGSPVTGWPTVSLNTPRAYDQTREVSIPAVGQTWAANTLTIRIPSTYDFSATDNSGQFLRLILTAPTGVDRHVGIDRIWFSTTLNEWSPDTLPPFGDGTYPIPTISPTSGNQGGGGGVGPPGGGGGGGGCISQSMPVLAAKNRRMALQPFRSTFIGQGVKGDQVLPYVVLRKRFGTAAEYMEITTSNGILYECTKRHRLVVDREKRVFIRAERVTVGTRLIGWVRGRGWVGTKVVTVKRIPKILEHGSYVLRDPTGFIRDGEGMYIAGFSKKLDRGLLSSNLKPLGDEGSPFI